MSEVVVAANTGFLWKDHPFLERIALAARHGFDAVEFHDEAQWHDLDDVRRALAEAGLPLLGLNTRMDDTAGCAALPDMKEQARNDIEQAIETARTLGGRAVHVMAGKPPREGGAVVAEAMEIYRDNLRFACDRAATTKTDAAPNGLRILIEPLCEAAVPGYAITSVAEAATVVRAVERPSLAIMFDVFHVRQADGDVLAAYAEHASMIGHVQLAHPETRAEPSVVGHDAVGSLVRSLRNAGYSRAFGAEYVPNGTVEEGLDWLDTVRKA